MYATVDRPHVSATVDLPPRPSSDVDEAHGYKNLATVSNIQGAAIPGSKRASDLHMKLEYLRVAHGERVGTFATATPIANSITEAHVTCRYLRPDLLEHAGIKHFDAWAATFGETVTQMEMAVTGGGNYRLNTRLARSRVLCPDATSSPLVVGRSVRQTSAVRHSPIQRTGSGHEPTKYENYEMGVRRRPRRSVGTGQAQQSSWQGS